MWHFQAYDALLFDCDGTLADTMPAHYRAWLAVTTAMASLLTKSGFTPSEAGPPATSWLGWRLRLAWSLMSTRQQN